MSHRAVVIILLHQIKRCTKEGVLKNQDSKIQLIESDIFWLQQMDYLGL